MIETSSNPVADDGDCHRSVRRRSGRAPWKTWFAAAKKEGTLTTIALPHDWCNYGGASKASRRSTASRSTN